MIRAEYHYGTIMTLKDTVDYYICYSGMMTCTQLHKTIYWVVGAALVVHVTLTIKIQKESTHKSAYSCESIRIGTWPSVSQVMNIQLCRMHQL